MLNLRLRSTEMFQKGAELEPPDKPLKQTILSKCFDLLKLWLSFFCRSLASARTSASGNDAHTDAINCSPDYFVIIQFQM